jgi:hypothetical protein
MPVALNDDQSALAQTVASFAERRGPRESTRKETAYLPRQHRGLQDPQSLHPRADDHPLPRRKSGLPMGGHPGRGADLGLEDKWDIKAESGYP